MLLFLGIVGFSCALAAVIFAPIAISNRLAEKHYDEKEYEAHCRYKVHTNQTSRNTVRISFEKWLAMYNADPIHWYKGEGYESVAHRKYMTPWYDNPETPEGWTFVTFATQKDYFKWKEFIEDLDKKGEDAANLERTLNLTKEISGVALKRSEKARKEAEEAMKQYQSTFENVMKNLKDQGYQQQGCGTGGV